MASTIIIAADVLDALVSAAQAIQTLTPILKQMATEGRTTLTQAEWDTITQDESGAAQSLLTAVQQAKTR